MDDFVALDIPFDITFELPRTISTMRCSTQSSNAAFRGTHWAFIDFARDMVAGNVDTQLSQKECKNTLFWLIRCVYILASLDITMPTGIIDVSYRGREVEYMSEAYNHRRGSWDFLGPILRQLPFESKVYYA